MTIIQIVVVLIVVGIVLWALNQFVPMDAQVKKILHAVVIIAVVVWLLMILLRFFDIGSATIGMAGPG